MRAAIHCIRPHNGGQGRRHAPANGLGRLYGKSEPRLPTAAQHLQAGDNRGEQGRWRRRRNHSMGQGSTPAQALTSKGLA